MKEKTTEEKEMIFKSLEEATGKIPYGLTNDYMFRAVLQKSEKVLRGLIGSLLHLSQEEIVSVVIMDPIIIGEVLSDKEFRLDINVQLNTNKKINLEMQVVNLGNWENRSLSYLCRSFDQLNKGQAYNEVKAAIHIGILDFTLFKDSPEFYAHYKMMNTKTHKIYSNNFQLNVLDLNHAELATEEDRQYNIDHWAKLFKSTTWEEIKEMALQDEYFKEASNTLFELSADEIVRKRCRDREDYYADMRGAQNIIDEQASKIEQQKSVLEQQKSVLEQQKSVLEQQKSVLEQQKSVLEQQKNKIEQQENKLEQQENKLEQQENKIDELTTQLGKKDDEIERMRKELADYRKSSEKI